MQETTESKKVSADFIEKHTNDFAKTKRLHLVLKENDYIVHVKAHRASDIRGQNFPGSSPAFNSFLRAAGFSDRVLVVVIERMKNMTILASKADNEDPESVQLDSATLARLRFGREMDDFRSAVENQTAQHIEELSPDTVLFLYVSMYATRQFLKLGDKEHVYKLLDSLPEEGEQALFVVW